MTKEHQIKIEKRYLERLTDGTKTCEIRLNDRDYQTGDRIHFMFQDPEIGQGFSADSWFNEPRRFEITHVLNFPEGLKDGYVALSLKMLEEDE